MFTNYDNNEESRTNFTKVTLNSLMKNMYTSFNITTHYIQNDFNSEVFFNLSFFKIFFNVFFFSKKIKKSLIDVILILINKKKLNF